jgi:hypothetical protein
MRNLILLATLCVALFNSCSKHTNAPGSPGGTTPPDTSATTPPPNSYTVYVAGTSGTANSNNAVRLWKNGQVAWTGDSSSAFAYCGGLFLADTDVYISGGIFGNPGTAGFWKNGIQTSLTPGYQAAGIAVYAAHTYIAGNSVVNTTYAFWIDSGSANLTLDNNTDPSYAMGVWTSGSDVYVAGSELEGGYAIAKYWKNGLSVDLPTRLEGLATDGLVSGADVYVCGQDSLYAVYWKNGVETVLPGSYVGRAGAANAMCISGSDIYIAGSIGNQAVYWKNGVSVTLTDGTNTGVANAIAVVGSNVYVAVNDGITPKYWNNGSLVTLSGVLVSGSANGIAVK